jgi:hypothetical protein
VAPQIRCRCAAAKNAEQARQADQKRSAWVPGLTAIKIQGPGCLRHGRQVGPEESKRSFTCRVPLSLERQTNILGCSLERPLIDQPLACISSLEADEALIHTAGGARKDRWLMANVRLPKRNTLPRGVSGDQRRQGHATPCCQARATASEYEMGAVLGGRLRKPDRSALADRNYFANRARLPPALTERPWLQNQCERSMP